MGAYNRSAIVTGAGSGIAQIGLVGEAAQVLHRIHRLRRRGRQVVAVERQHGVVGGGHPVDLAHHLAQPVQRSALAGNPPDTRALSDTEVALVLDHDDRRPAPEKRVARPLLSTLDAFQQIGRRAVIDLGERRHGRVLIRQNFPVQRNEVTPLRVRPEFVQVE